MATKKTKEKKAEKTKEIFIAFEPPVQAVCQMIVPKVYQVFGRLATRIYKGK